MKKALGISAIILALAVTVFLLRPRTVRAQSGCTVAALAGTYGFSMLGDYYYTYQGQTYSAFLSGGGLFAFDGNGGVTGSDTINDDGTLNRGNLSGTYTVNSNCTGSMTLSDSNQYQFSFDLVIVNGGKEVTFVETDTGNITTGSAKLQ